MDPNTILRIIELSLRIAVDVIEHMPATEKAAFWARHEARIAFWQGLVEKLNPPSPAK